MSLVSVPGINEGIACNLEFGKIYSPPLDQERVSTERLCVCVGGWVGVCVWVGLKLHCTIQTRASF